MPTALPPLPLSLRGRKRFRLYDPSQAEHMYTHGRLVGVHPNGRIVYEGQGAIQPDGTDVADVALWRDRRAAEAEVAAAEEAVKKGTKVGPGDCDGCTG